MTLDIPALHAETLAAIKAGGRGLRRFSPAEVAELSRALRGPAEELEGPLCLLVHSSHPEPAWEPPLLELLRRPLPAELIVYALNAARKHVVLARFKEGKRLDMDFLEILRELLGHPSAEVVEWTLRTVEECGAQGVLLRPQVSGARPPLWSLWRARSRTILELVTLLERRWAPFEKP